MTDQDWQSEKSLSETNLHMLKSQLLADVTFLVGEQKEKTLAHTFILVSRSCVFEAMFCGPMAEKNIVEIPDVESIIFGDFLSFIYTNDVILQPDTVLPLLYVAKKYSVKSLEKKCVDFCDSTLSPENACTFLQQAYYFDEESLKVRALRMIAEQATSCLASDGFKDLGKNCLDLVLESDELTAEEIDVFKAAIMWAKVECGRHEREVTGDEMRNVLGNSLNLIRFPLISQEKLTEIVVPENILTDSQLVSLFIRYTKPEASNCQFSLKKRKRTTIFTLNRSLNKRHRYMGTNRTDALLVSCDKYVYLQAIYLYGGAMESPFEMNVRLQIVRNELVVSELSNKINVRKDDAIYRMPLDVPANITSFCDHLLTVTCQGPQRWLCTMNGQTQMVDEASGTRWKLSHPKSSGMDDSIIYGHICGFEYSFNA